jgi:hypothetical protein
MMKLVGVLVVAVLAMADTTIRSYDCKGFVKYTCVQKSGHTTSPRLEPYRGSFRATWHETCDGAYAGQRAIADRGCKDLQFRVVDWAAPPICWEQSEEEPPTPNDWPVKP